MTKMHRKGEYTIHTDKAKLDLRVIHDFLKNSYWVPNIPYETVARSIEHSLCFGLYQGEYLVGFARVLTDYSRSAHLFDVFILEAHRGKGLSKWLMECIMAHPFLRDIPSWVLATRDAHGLYEKFGFVLLQNPDKYMQIKKLNPYGGAR